MIPPSVSCPCCVSTEQVPGVSREGYHYLRCVDCGSSFLHPPPERPVDLFDQQYLAGGAVGGYADYVGDEGLHRKNARDRLRRIAQAWRTAGRPLKPGAVLDIGCAVPFFLSEAQAAGWRTQGVEPAEWARARSTRVLGWTPKADVSQVTDGPFDVVTIFQALEHMADPFALLCAVRPLLRPNGLLVVETWDGGHWLPRLLGPHWQQISPPSVLHVFTREGLRALYARSGFAPPVCLRSSKRVSMKFVTTLLSGKHPLMRVGPQVIERLRLGDASLIYPLGDLITVFSRPQLGGEPTRPDEA